MIKDPIVDELDLLRAEQMAQFNFDFEAFYRNLKEQEKLLPQAVQPPPESPPSSGRPAPPSAADAPGITRWSRVEATMKAIIEVARRGSIFQSVAQQVADAREGRVPNFRLRFESARSLFAELTPARLDLLDTLRRVGPCSIYALAKAAERDDSNVHTDAMRLEQLGLIERSEEGVVSVPFEAVEILVPLAQSA